MAQVAIPLLIASTAASAAGSIMGGNAQRASANFQAAQLEQQAGQERASAQRKAILDRERADLAGSRIQALAAAGGGGATDPTVEKLRTDVAGRGEYEALSSLFTGEERARGMESAAGARRYEGQVARRAGVIGAVAQVGQGAYMASSVRAPSTAANSGSTLFDSTGGGFLDWLDRRAP